MNILDDLGVSKWSGNVYLEVDSDNGCNWSVQEWCGRCMRWAAWSVCTVQRPGPTTKAPADGVRGRGRGVPGHPHHRQHGGARHEGEGHHRWRMWSALAWVLCVYQVCPMLMFLCAHSCRRRSGQGCCQRRHGQQSGHVSAGHRCQASRGTVLRGGAQHVLRSESGERSRHRDRGASGWGAHQHQWSSCSRSW